MSPTGEPPVAAGFTLLELLVTLAVAGLLLTLVPPLMERGSDRARLQSDTRRLSGALGLARSQAIAGAAEVPFVIDLEARRYGIDGGGNGFSGVLDPGVAVQVEMAAADRLGDRRGLIRFFPDGSSSGGTIHLGNRAGGAIIEVDWLTGKVTGRREPPR